MEAQFGLPGKGLYLIAGEIVLASLVFGEKGYSLEKGVVGPSVGGEFDRGEGEEAAFGGVVFLSEAVVLGDGGVVEQEDTLVTEAEAGA